jgi:hypothetical protein
MNFLAPVEAGSAVGWPGKATEDQSVGYRRLEQDNVVAQAEYRSPRAIVGAEDVKAPVLGTNGVDDAA